MKVARVNDRPFQLLTGATTPGGTGIGGGTPLPTPVALGLPYFDMQQDGLLVGDGVTDDTAAFQAAITTGTGGGAQSCTFYFPPGTYLIGGALQDTGARNAQIILPVIPISASTPQIVIRFLGSSRPPFAIVPTQNIGAPAGFSIIKSTLTGASGTAAVISAGNTTYNNLRVELEDLICIGPANPTMTFWNLQNSQGTTIRDSMVWTADWLGGTLPTHSNSYGVKLPGDTQGNYTYVEGLSVRNFYTGIRGGDLVKAGGLQISVCVVAWENPAGSWHSLIRDMFLNGCLYGIRGTGAQSQLDVLSYSHEHYPSDPTYATVYDLDDPSNYIHGAIRWWNVQWSVGPDHSFAVNGGSHTSNAEVGPLTSGTGTVTSVALTVPAEFSVSGSPVTTSGTLAVTKATETANTVWAGPTSGGAAQPTFRALVTADMPSGIGAHYLVVASSHSTPLIFGDLVQTSAGDDLIFTS